MSDPNVRYDQPPAMEPLLPEARGFELAEFTTRILVESGALSARLHPVSAAAMANVVRQMNSYYSNLIEGQPTLPADIEAAQRHDFSRRPAERERQCLGLAHAQAEEQVELRLRDDPTLAVESTEFLCWLHAEFYGRLPDAMRVATSKDGPGGRIVPGALRETEVDVGLHHAPQSRSVRGMLGALFSRYGSQRIGATRRIVAAAAAHHRVLWVHPFRDGNGRVVRLLSHAMLIRAGLGGMGLWTLSRGLARRRSDYYALLQAADQPRVNDFDGRGNLSDRTLADFCVFFLEVLLDQVRFMSGLLQLSELEDRIMDYLARDPTMRSRAGFAGRLLATLLRRGELLRGELPTLLDRSESVARDVVRRLIAAGLVESENQKAPLRIAFPVKVHEAYFPRLFLPQGSL